MDIHREQTIAEIVQNAPATARAFERLGIDYCCRGKLALQVACERANLPLDRVLVMLHEAASERGAKPIPDDLHGLLARIVDEHHAFTRAELERLAPLWRKVLRVHGGSHPELARVAQLCEAMNEHLAPHMLKEERVLFPAIMRLASGQDVQFPFGAIDNPLAAMESEHEELGAWLAELSQLTQGYLPPEGACGSYRALYAGLLDLQRDLHEHVYLENHLLFPMARQLAARRKAG